MSSLTFDQLDQRGKRRAAFRAEGLILVLIVCSLLEITDAYKVLEMVFIPTLFYSAALRGLDAWANKLQPPGPR